MGAFPAVAPQLCVYLQMSGHQGSVECHMEVEYLAMGDVIAETETRTVYFNDPSAVVVIYFRLANCVLPSAGLYYVQAYADEKLIGERPLLLQLEE
jgi:hypothetical protein